MSWPNRYVLGERRFWVAGIVTTTSLPVTILAQVSVR